MSTFGRLGWVVALCAVLGATGCGAGDEFTTSAPSGSDAATGGSGGDASTDGPQQDVEADAQDANPDIGPDAVDASEDVSVDVEDGGGDAPDDVPPGDGAEEGDAPLGCGVDGAPCALSDGNGLCLGDVCSACVEVTDDALCQAGWGTSTEPSICVGGKCVPGCREDSACQTGNCVDQVCCDKPASACQGCKACNVQGSEGTCTSVPSGQDPHDACTANTATCTLASCNGQGTCSAADNTSCGTPSCSNGVESAPVCQSGACVTLTDSCAPFVCNGNVCASSCDTPSNAGCEAEYYCVGGTTCAVKLALGAVCTLGTQCQSGSCVDGVCCSSAACGKCHACNLAGSMGTCTPVADGTDPRDDCAHDPSTCSEGSCKNGACAPATAGTICAVYACTETGCYGQCTSATQATGVCDGHAIGTCPNSSGTISPCPAALVCASSTTCLASCGVDADCIKNNYCAASSCTKKKQDGEPCMQPRECASNACHQGHCAACAEVSDCTPGAAVCMPNWQDGCQKCQTSTDCKAAHWGSTCTLSGVCACTNDDQCGARGPSCTSFQCRCGDAGVCGLGEYCTSRTATGICRIAPGQPCTQNADCAGGLCQGGKCGRVAAGQPCYFAADCESNVCLPSLVCK